MQYSRESSDQGSLFWGSICHDGLRRRTSSIGHLVLSRREDGQHINSHIVTAVLVFVLCRCTACAARNWLSWELRRRSMARGFRLSDWEAIDFCRESQEGDGLFELFELNVARLVTHCFRQRSWKIRLDFEAICSSFVSVVKDFHSSGDTDLEVASISAAAGAHLYAKLQAFFVFAIIGRIAGLSAW